MDPAHLAQAADLADRIEAEVSRIVAETKRTSDALTESIARLAAHRIDLGEPKGET